MARETTFKNTAGERDYLRLLNEILQDGTDRGDRTGTGTRSVFGRQIRFDLQQGFPLLTTKKVIFEMISSELLWFLEGSGDERRLAEIRYGKDRAELNEKKTIWSGNAEAPYWKPKAKFEGDLGRPYGKQLREWTNQFGDVLDQVTALISGLKTDPNSRRHILTWWNPGEADYMALPACHMLAQFYIVGSKLNCMFSMRSSDSFLGLPANIASYALLTYMLAHVLELEVGDLIYSGGDIHIYSNHLDAVREQLSRQPKAPPTLVINRKVESIFDFKMSDFEIVEYDPHPAIKAPMAV